MTQVRQLWLTKNLSHEHNGCDPAPTSYSWLDELTWVAASTYTSETMLRAVTMYLLWPPILQTKKLLTDSVTCPGLLSSMAKLILCCATLCRRSYMRVYELQIEKLLFWLHDDFCKLALFFFFWLSCPPPTISCCIQNLKANCYSRHSTAEINIRVSPPCEPAIMIWSRLGPQIANEVKYKIR